MTKKFYKKLSVIMMLTMLAQLFGLGVTANDKVFTRMVTLSGNTFSFSLPENFSKDMSAANMVEQLDVEDLQRFDNPEYGNIIRRWWDIKKSGFFGESLGTVMMDISVQRVPENQQKLLSDAPYNMYNRLDFIMAIDDQLHQRFDQLNLETEPDILGEDAYYFNCCSLIGDRISSNYRDYVYGGQKWLGYSVAANLNQLITGLVLPLTNNTLLEIVFTYSPNQGVLPREFLDVAYKTTEVVENSLKVNYAEGNEVRLLVERDWLEKTNNEVFAENYDTVLIPLFGPDVHKNILESRRLAIEFQKEMEKQ